MVSFGPKSDEKTLTEYGNKILNYDNRQKKQLESENKQLKKLAETARDYVYARDKYGETDRNKDRHIHEVKEAMLYIRLSLTTSGNCLKVASQNMNNQINEILDAVKKHQTLSLEQENWLDCKIEEFVKKHSHSFDERFSSNLEIMHRAEKLLTPEQQFKYVHILLELSAFGCEKMDAIAEQLVNDETFEDKVFDRVLKESLIAVACAPALNRAVAFVLTVG